MGSHRSHGQGPAPDHLGLFDPDPHDPHAGASDAADGDDAGVSSTGEGVDLIHLRDVLAGRRPAPGQEDDGDDGDHPNGPGHPRRAASAGPRHGRGRRRHPVRSTILAVLVMALIAAGVVTAVVWWQHSTARPVDWAGSGGQSVVVRVQSGDGLTDVGQMLVDSGVVASVKAFVQTASDDGSLSGLQPGYYLVHEHSSAQAAVKDLANPDNRLGHLRIIPGQTLADITTVSTDGHKTTKPGILSAIAAACVPTKGQEQCFTTGELRHAAETADPGTLGVVGWAVDAVHEAPDPRRRLEGLILPGDYDIAPGSTALQALTSVVSASAARWNTTGIVTAAKRQHLSPYQLAIVASLVQSEAIGPDMRKVARVIYNRLDADMKLQFDSTVNYGLDRSQISTTESERLDPDNRYSTYAHAGLPPTPIGAPGPTALDAADDPASGSWLYFVAVDKEGHSCFSTTPEQHQACVDRARANGVFG